MSRWIDADAVKNIIRSGVSTDTEDDQEYVCGLIDEAPTIDAIPIRPQGEWIPCSERLPSKGVAVLVNGIMYDAPPITISTDAPYYYEQGWINAWMPLPEPWKGADDETD